jgi:hypothetical protein
MLVVTTKVQLHHLGIKLYLDHITLRKFKFSHFGVRCRVSMWENLSISTVDIVAMTRFRQAFRFKLVCLNRLLQCYSQTYCMLTLFDYSDSEPVINSWHSDIQRSRSHHTCHVICETLSRSKITNDSDVHMFDRSRKCALPSNISCRYHAFNRERLSHLFYSFVHSFKLLSHV